MSLLYTNYFLVTEDLKESIIQNEFDKVIECPKELDISTIRGVPSSFSYRYDIGKKLKNTNSDRDKNYSVRDNSTFQLEGLQEEGKNNFLAKLDWKIRINPVFTLKGVPFISKKEIKKNFEMAGIKVSNSDIGCAYPVGNYNLTIDVANNHYSNYYNGKEAPTDTHFPIPTIFWVIKDAIFRFRCDLGKEALAEALEQYGLGKQGSTYGHFTLL